MVGMWLVVGKVLLLLFLVVGVAVIVVTYRRKSKNVESRPDPNGYLAHFNHPTLTPPEWVNWTDDNSEGPPTKRDRAGP